MIINSAVGGESPQPVPYPSVGSQQNDPRAWKQLNQKMEHLRSVWRLVYIVAEAAMMPVSSVEDSALRSRSRYTIFGI